MFFSYHRLCYATYHKAPLIANLNNFEKNKCLNPVNKLHIYLFIFVLHIFAQARNNIKKYYLCGCR
jgi:hypothetical protein